MLAGRAIAVSQEQSLLLLLQLERVRFMLSVIPSGESATLQTSSINSGLFMRFICCRFTLLALSIALAGHVQGQQPPVTDIYRSMIPIDGRRRRRFPAVVTATVSTVGCDGDAKATRRGDSVSEAFWHCG